MKKFFFILPVLIMTQTASAETIELGDRSVIVAKIIERTDHDITVNRDGVRMTYLLDEIISIDGDLDENIFKLLKARGYPKNTWSDIAGEFKDFLVKIDFLDLKKQVKQAQNDPEELKRIVKVLGGSIKRQGCLVLQNPHPLIKLLVNSLGDEDILSVEVKREIFACSAISQLASMILDLLGIDAKIMIAPGHVFNAIPLNSRQVLFADFSNEIFEIVDMAEFYRTDGKYQVLKEEQRLSAKRVLEINDQWYRGFMPRSQREILNLGLYFYIYMTDNISATAIIDTNRGNDDEFKGDFIKALENYSKALQVNPHIAGVYCNRGLAFADQGYLTQAIADYDKALEINPNDDNAYNDRGLAFKNKGDTIKAISDYNKAIEINPNSPQVYINRGNAYSLQGDLTQGIIDYTKAIEIDPGSAVGYINRSAGYYYLRKYDKAWEDVDRAEELGGAVNPQFINKLKRSSGRS